MDLISNLMRPTVDHIIFTGNKLDVMIPYHYIERNLATLYGERIELFGLVDVLLDDKIKEVLNLPTMITIYPHEINEKTIDNEKYVIATFFKNDIFTDVNIRQDSSNVEIFINMIFSGKMPRFLKYNDILKVWLKNLSLNSIDLGTSSTILEIIIAEVCRYKNDPQFKFAEMIAKDPTISQYDYTMASIRDICAQNSTFAALTFEDMDAMIISSLNINKYKKEESDSPIEKTIKM
ncbi:MAG: hypothetical protein PHF63_00420 [Herbinix sp.]|nr:hypothetical protein [Herbinix sp.]